jgi:hypothetical protein
MESIAYLLMGSEHTYLIVEFQGEVHSIWDLWTSGPQKCKGFFYFFYFFESRQGGQ